MRIKDNRKIYDNEEYIKEFAKQLSQLFEIPPYLVKKLLYTIYVSIIHKVSCDALDSEDKLRDVNIEIPHFGNLKLDVSDSNNIQVIEFELEESFKEDIQKAVTLGESKLFELAKDKALQRIKDRFNNILG